MAPSSALSFDNKQKMRTDAIGMKCKLFHFMSYPEQLSDALENGRILLQCRKSGSFPEHRDEILGHLLISLL
jgi:hypothetical protein